MIGKLLATIPVLVLIGIHLSLFLLPARRKVVGIVLAFVVLGAWLPFRYLYFLTNWDIPDRSVGDTVYYCLGNWGWYDTDGLKDLWLLDHGLLRTLQHHPSSKVRYNCAVLLALRSHLSHQEALVVALDDDDFYVRLASALAVWRHNDPGVSVSSITKNVDERSLEQYLGVQELPSVPYGDADKEFWQAFIDKVKADFGDMIRENG